MLNKFNQKHKLTKLLLAIISVVFFRLNMSLNNTTSLMMTTLTTTATLPQNLTVVSTIHPQLNDTIDNIVTTHHTESDTTLFTNSVLSTDVRTDEMTTFVTSTVRTTIYELSTYLIAEATSPHKSAKELRDEKLERHLLLTVLMISAYALAVICALVVVMCKDRTSTMYIEGAGRYYACVASRFSRATSSGPKDDKKDVRMLRRSRSDTCLLRAEYTSCNLEDAC